MSSAVGLKVHLELFDPDAGYAYPPPAAGWPIVEGRLVAAVPGLYGLMWYLLELDRALPAGFNPLSTVPERFQLTPVKYLLVSPAPNMPTGEIPADFIGEGLAQGGIIPVGVLVGSTPEELPFAITLDHIQSGLYPSLCSGKLKPMRPEQIIGDRTNNWGQRPTNNWGQQIIGDSAHLFGPGWALQGN